MQVLSRDQPFEEWPATIRAFMAEVKYNPDWIDNLVVDSRYAWKLLLNLPTSGTLLDIGCGLGNLIHNLSPHFDKVYGLDLTWERLQFSQRRCALFNPSDDIQFVAGGDGERLPFRDESIDCVTLSGVLEWVPENLSYPETSKGRKLGRMLFSITGSANPRRQQVQFLREVRRILKHCGQLFIGIENRFNYEYFTGRPDHHTRLRYGSLLPRHLANLYAIAKRRKPYRTYTHSLCAYRRLLTAAGFPEAKFVGLLDGYSKLRKMVPYGDFGVQWKPRAASSLKGTVKHHPWFVPAFGIMASPSGQTPSDSLLTRMVSLVGEAFDNSANEVVLTDNHIISKGKAIFEGRCGDAQFVLRIPFSDQACHSEANNWRMLHADKSGIIRSPAPIVSGNVAACPFYVESKVQGDTIASQQQLSTADSLTLVEQYLATWPKGERSDFTSSSDNAILNEAIKALCTVAIDKPLIERLHAYLVDELVDRSVVVGISHGDFSAKNIFLKDSTIVGVIDWEYGQAAGVQLLDTFCIVDSLNRRKNGGTVLSLVEHYVGKSSLPDESADFLSKRAEEQGYSPSELRALSAFYWLKHIYRQLESGMIYDQARISSRVDQGLESVLALVAT